MDSKTNFAGYKYLLTYQLSVAISNLTVEFCNKLIDKKSRTHDQMVQAARSGKQNIVEGYLEKSLKNYIYLLGISLGSFGELGEDYLDYLRQHRLPVWNKDDPRVRGFREVRVFGNNLDNPNIPELPESPEKAANLLFTLVNQVQYLLRKQISALEQKFVREGGFTENLFKKRVAERNQNKW